MGNDLTLRRQQTTARIRGRLVSCNQFAIVSGILVVYFVNFIIAGYGTAVDHVLAMAFDDPSMDCGLRRALEAHEVVLGGDWPDIW